MKQEQNLLPSGSQAQKCRVYGTLWTRIERHIDWYLSSTLLPEGKDSTWTLEEIQDKIHSATGIKPRKSTILRRNSRLFRQYQCSPLRRVDVDKYCLDPVYYRIAGKEVRPPQTNRGRPRKKYLLQDDVELDAGI